MHCAFFFVQIHLRGWLLTVLITEETSLRLKVVSSSSPLGRSASSSAVVTCREAKSQEMGEMLRSPMLPPILSALELRPSEGTPNWRSVPSLTSRSNSPSKICRAWKKKWIRLIFTKKIWNFSRHFFFSVCFYLLTESSIFTRKMLIFREIAILKNRKIDTKIQIVNSLAESKQNLRFDGKKKKKKC